MIYRTTIIQNSLLAFFVVLFATGVIPLSPQDPVLWVAGTLTALFLVADGFLIWKFVVQPWRHGFRFNPSQNPEAISRRFAGIPAFYDTEADEQFSWVSGFEEKSPQMIGEIRGFVAQGHGKGSSANEAFKTAYQNEMLSLSPTWKTLNLMSYGTENGNFRMLPQTREIVSAVPNVFTCNLSKLAPHTDVRPHAGEATSYIRCHFGVEVPAPAPTTALQVADQQRSWEEGKVLAFCDGHWHSAHNHSEGERYVLIFDVMPNHLGWYTDQYCALMVALNVANYLLPGRVGLDEPIWKPSVFLGSFCFATVGVPLFAIYYLYFRYICRDKTPWMRRLANAGFGFYY